jgi:uncharacterized protein DUF6174
MGARMKSLNTPARWLLLIGVAALGCGLLALFSSSQSPRTQLASAKSRWAGRTVSHYRLIVEAGRPCRLDVEVRDERVIAVFHQDACGYPARTVTDLFNMVERAPTPMFTCAPPSCACRNVVTVYAIYDEQLGYPRKIAVRAERESNWGDFAFWRQLWSAWSLPDCRWASYADIVNVPFMAPLQ